jgi:hypothetical protein
MEPEGSLPRSQELSTCTYPELDQSSSKYSFLSLKGIKWEIAQGKLIQIIGRRRIKKWNIKGK